MAAEKHEREKKKSGGIMRRKVERREEKRGSVEFELERVGKGGRKDGGTKEGKMVGKRGEEREMKGGNVRS